jgi:signal transduction histidine kinase
VADLPAPESASGGDAVGSALRVLLGVSGSASVTVWEPGEDGPRRLGGAGLAAGAGADLRADVIALLAGRVPHDPHLSAVEIERPGAPPALLLAHHPAEPAGAHLDLLRAARPALAALLRRRPDGTGGSETAATAATAAERRLQRLRFDLHDGPQQEVHLLAQDLRLFRSQLAPMIEDHPDRDRAIGRLDDLEAQLIALDEDLRRLATAVRSPLLGRTLATALVDLAEAFSARTGIVPSTELSGDVEALTESQQIALLSVVREALTNVRQHSDADQVAITVAAGDDTISVEVRDDGSGFDPDVDGPRAARSGRLGLVGMRERMRMLGGRTEITSAPGGPTVVAATLPRWPVEPAS